MIYIGSTREYQFVYDKEKKRVTILNNSRLRQVTLKQLRTGI
jgi:hypothetical protein